MEELSFSLPTFSGPLDLLLHLIEKNKVSIYDIPIADITDQYMAYLGRDEEVGPRHHERVPCHGVYTSFHQGCDAAAQGRDGRGRGDRSQDELVEQLLEYKMVKTMAGKLRDMSENAGAFCYKKPTDSDGSPFL